MNVTRRSAFLTQIVLLFVSVSLLSSCSSNLGTDLPSQETKAPAISKSEVGRMEDGTVVDEYRLKNANGMEISVMTYGATLRSVKAADREGNLAEVALLMDSFEDYLSGHPLFGSVVGRFANRIAGAQFILDGQTFDLTPNADPHHIHGGRLGFQKLVWEAQSFTDSEGIGVRLSLMSPDGTEGYPGNLRVETTYRLNDENCVSIEYEAETDKPTHINLTNHAYWNLGGAGSGDVLEHILTLNADTYLPADEKKIPLGTFKSVEGTPMDFRKPVAIGARIQEVEGENYDHCYVLNGNDPIQPSLAARLVDPNSGRIMEVYTTQPGVQLYTAKTLKDRFSFQQRPYGPYHGVCLETQHFPDSPNHPEFPSTVLRPDETFRQVTEYRFSTVK